MGKIICPYCERKIDLERDVDIGWVICPKCCGDLEFKDKLGGGVERYFCLACSTFVYVLQAEEKMIAGLVPTWLQEFEKEAGYR